VKRSTDTDSVIEAARAGAEWAWSQLYGELSGPVLGYLRAHGAVEPEDLLGEVFVQVARNIATFDGDGPGFRSWVFTVAHHRIIDERRYRARRPVIPAEVGEWDGATGNVEDEALESIATDGVLQMLEGLTDDQRSVVLLRIIGDQTIDEIAAVLGKRRGAVKALQRRGFEALRRAATKRGVPK
jgi:RNA polymerase sigma-70 factor (ECF subfamily)